MLGGSSSQNLWQKAHLILISIIMFERTCSKLKFYCFANIKGKNSFQDEGHIIWTFSWFSSSWLAPPKTAHHHKRLQQSVTSIEISTWFGAFVLNQTSLHLMTQTWNLRKHSAYKERRPCIYKNQDGKHLQKVQGMLKQM